MQAITLRCDDAMAEHIYGLLSNTKGIQIEKTKISTSKQTIKHDFLEFVGLWRDRDVSLTCIRKKAWSR